MSLNIQTYFDETTNEPLDLSFQLYEVFYKGVLVRTKGVPLLKNNKTGKVYLPEATRQVIDYLVKEEIKKGSKKLILNPENMEGERYSYVKEYKFKYSTIDHEYIPGLTRPWDEGFLAPVFLI